MRCTKLVTSVVSCPCSSTQLSHKISQIFAWEIALHNSLLEASDETCPPQKISESGSGCYRTTGTVSRCIGGRLSDPVGSDRGRLPSRGCTRHPCASGRS